MLHRPTSLPELFLASVGDHRRDKELLAKLTAEPASMGNVVDAAMIDHKFNQVRAPPSNEG